MREKNTHTADSVFAMRVSKPQLCIESSVTYLENKKLSYRGRTSCDGTVRAMDSIAR